MALNVLDVSSHQGDGGCPDSVYQMSEEILIVKVTEGTGYVNPYWRSQVQAARNAGMMVGLYHFPSYGDSTEQLNYFLNEVGDGIWGNGWAIPILDWENSQGSPTMTTYQNFGVDFLEGLAQRTGATPWVYMNTGTANNADDRFHEYPLWVASYAFSDANPGFTVRAPYETWVVPQISNWTGTVIGYQHTETGRLNGYSGNLDMSVLFADRAELEGYARGNTSTSVGTAASLSVSMPVPVSMIYPVDPNVYTVSQSFYQDETNMNAGLAHGAIDFRTPVGTSVSAVADGTVIFADWSKNLPRGNDYARYYIGDGEVYGVLNAGIIVLIDHGDFISEYAHLNSTSLNAGQTVSMGDEIGKSGATGYVYGAHLHWGVMKKPIDFSNGYYGRTDPEAMMIERNGYARKDAVSAAVVESDFLEEIMALYNTKEEFEQALEKIVGKRLTAIHDELTPGKAGVKNAGSIFLLLYNLQGHLESFKNLFLPGKEKVRFEGDIRGILRKIADKAGK